MPTVKLSAIQLDASIQCRAAVDTSVVNEYADAMRRGAKFPPVDLFENGGRYWIGDGWHRVLARKENGAATIDAKSHRGGRLGALRFALSANALHGHRRTNADKRRCVEIALREFANLSSRAIAEMCGVDDKTVAAVRGTGAEIPRLPVTGTDGKQYPARRKAPIQSTKSAPVQATEPSATNDPGKANEGASRRQRFVRAASCHGMQYARIAVDRLSQIPTDDRERNDALAYVWQWINAQPGFDAVVVDVSQARTKGAA